jgi:peptide deformylase
MTIRPVVKMGNKQLASPSDIVNLEQLSHPTILNLVQDMQDTMSEGHGVGLAAPQIGVNKRVIMFGFEANKRYPQEKSVPFTILINPSFSILSEEMVDAWEGCLSIPGIRGLVPRYKHIEYSGYNLEGQLITRRVEGFHARVVQHECDHLDGILYPQRIKDLRYFGFEEELNLF